MRAVAALFALLPTRRYTPAGLVLLRTTKGGRAFGLLLPLLARWRRIFAADGTPLTAAVSGRTSLCCMIRRIAYFLLRRAATFLAVCSSSSRLATASQADRRGISFTLLCFSFLALFFSWALPQDNLAIIFRFGHMRTLRVCDNTGALY
jgi:hypothetical protein